MVLESVPQSEKPPSLTHRVSASFDEHPSIFSTSHNESFRP